MDKYVFVLVAFAFLLPLILIYLFRRDLRDVILKAGGVGALIGPASEFWYFQDYWRPPTLLGVARISIEDVLFGIGGVGMAAVLYKVVFRRCMGEKEYPMRYVILGALFVVGLASLLVFNNVLHINSILVSSLTFLVCAGVIVAIRRDLLVASVLSGLLLMLFALLIYIPLFNNSLGINYLDKYWLLSGTPLGVTVLGNVPLTELLWHFSWGCLGGVAYEFVTGRGLQKVKSSSHG